MQQPSNRVLGVAIVALLLALYSMRSTPVKEIHIDTDETSVSLCQVRVQFNESNIFDDRTILLLLTIFKKNNFQINPPVWGPSDTLLYLCEHRLTTGLKQKTIDKELNNIIKDSGKSSKHLAWLCA